MTICRQWAWKPNDNMKSTKQCIQSLLHTVGGNGNLLFNVGPMPDGLIDVSPRHAVGDQTISARAHLLLALESDTVVISIGQHLLS